MTKIKICGLRWEEDIKSVNYSQPDYIGFVFAPSKRRISEKNAANLKVKLDSHIKSVGVFANQDIDTITRLYNGGTIDLVQLHGEEDSKYVKKLRQNCDCPIIKAIGVGKITPDIPEGADYILFDTASSERGGSGKLFDWDLIKDCTGIPYFLAGGLNIKNITKAIDTLHPYCVDVSSSVETNGSKDFNKIHRLIQKVRRHN